MRPVVLVALVVALAACSGGGDDPSATATAPAARLSTPATGSAGVTRAQRLSDARLARNLVLRSKDLPGWHARKPPSEAAGNRLFRRLCTRLARTRSDLVDAEGGELPSASTAFVAGNRGLPLVRSKVYVLGTLPLAARAYTLLSSAEYAHCVGRSFSNPSLRASDVTYGTPRVAATAVRRIGNESYAYRIIVPTKSGDVSYDTRLDLVAIRRGRAVHLLVLADAALLPLTQTARNSILRAVERRLHTI